MRTNSFTNRMELIVALMLATARRNGHAAIRTSEALRNLRAEQTAYDRAVAAKKVLLRSAQRRYESAIREAAKKWAAAQTLSDRRVGSYSSGAIYARGRLSSARGDTAAIEFAQEQLQKSVAATEGLNLAKTRLSEHELS